MKKIVLWSVFIIIFFCSFLIYWNYYNVYSNGERKGALIKITRKGNLYKTVEGEMWLSCRQVVNAEKFYFSVVDKAIIDSIVNLQDECIEVTYKQYRHSLPWRGDSPYIVVGFKKL